MSLFVETHPTDHELMRFADDGGRLPEKDKLAFIGHTLRIRLPANYSLLEAIKELPSGLPVGKRILFSWPPVSYR